MSSHLSRKVSRKCSSTDAGVEKVSRNKVPDQEQKLDRSTSCREAIKEAGAFSIYPPGIKKLSRL